MVVATIAVARSQMPATSRIPSVSSNQGSVRAIVKTAHSGSI
jgi:hypothetical protein